MINNNSVLLLVFRAKLICSSASVPPAHSFFTKIFIHKNPSQNLIILEAVLKWFPNFIMRIIRDIFRLRKRERSSSYVTDDEDENVRKGRVRKERNRFKTASYFSSSLNSFLDSADECFILTLWEQMRQRLTVSGRTSEHHHCQSVA